MESTRRTIPSWLQRKAEDDRDSTLSHLTLRGLVPRLRLALHRCRFGLAAFLIPLGIRAIPEIIVGQYPVGWDTIAFYVPNTLDWAAGKASVLQMLGTAPLMYMDPETLTISPNVATGEAELTIGHR